jgi:hypothetical protein
MKKEKERNGFDEKFVLKASVTLMIVFFLGVTLAMLFLPGPEEKGGPEPQQTVQRSTRYAP